MTKSSLAKVLGTGAFALLFGFSALGATPAASSSPSKDGFWSEIRVFALTHQLAAAPDSYNALTSGDNVKALSEVTGFGVETNFMVGWLLKMGLRGGGYWTKMQSTTSTNTNAYLALQQGWGGAIARIPVLNSNLVQIDVFGEAGLAVTHIDVSTMNNGAGTFTKSFNPYERAGASFGVGWKKFYLYAEAGYQWENLDTMSYAGTLTTSLSAINLSGPFYGAGIIISGLPGLGK